MTLSKTINLFAIVIGGALTLYAQAGKDQNIYILIGGIVMLMFGIYRTSRGIPSKYDTPSEDESFIKTEDDT